MNEGGPKALPQLTIRLYKEGGPMAFFVHGDCNGTYQYAEYSSFLGIPTEVIRDANYVEIRADVIPNSYRLGVHTFSEGSGSLYRSAEVIVTGSYVVVTARTLLEARMGLNDYLKGLGDHLAEQERMAVALSVRAHQP